MTKPPAKTERAPGPAASEDTGRDAESAAQDRRKISYAGSFDSPVRQRIIQALELVTGKLPLLTRLRRFQALGILEGQPFWSQALTVMGIELTTPEAEIARIPPTGPLVITATHPHGVVDGMMIAELIGRVRTDYKILARAVGPAVSEIDQFLIPAPFPHEPDALHKGLEMRREGMDHLAQGGAIVIFPAGEVASSDTAFGPVIEGEWHAFTAKMIFRSRATVLPVRFPGQNSRAYQIASQLSATLRQGLLLHEVRHVLDTPQRPYVGTPILPDEIANWTHDPRGFVSWLRDRTLSLSD